MTKPTITPDASTFDWPKRTPDKISTLMKGTGIVNAFCPGEGARDNSCPPGRTVKVDVKGMLTEVVVNPSKEVLGRMLDSVPKKPNGDTEPNGYIRGLVHDGEVYLWQGIDPEAHETRVEGGSITHDAISFRLFGKQSSIRSSFYLERKNGHMVVSLPGGKGGSSIAYEWAKKNGLTTNAFCPTGPGGGVDPTCSPTKNLIERLGESDMPFDKFPVPKIMYRGTEVGTKGSEFRDSTEGGELGVGMYVTPHKWLAETYGGGPKASVKKGTREVHELEVAKHLYPEDVGYLTGGAKDGEAALVSGNGIELWRGKWQAKTSQRSNVTEMNRKARESSLKLIVGLEDSVAHNQVLVLDKSILKKVQR